MSPRIARVALLLVLLAPALAGCTLTWTRGPGEDGNRLPMGRTLVLGRAETEGNRPTVETAADLLATALEDAGRVVRVRELLGQARALGLEAWAHGLVARIQRGAWPTADEARALQTRFDLDTVLATDVTVYDQVWGKFGKFTRVGVAAQAWDLRSAQALWRLRGESEVESMRGRAFQYSMEQAVDELAVAIRPKLEVSLVKAWRYWRR